MSIDDSINIPYGRCHCGCGRKTNLATKTVTKRGTRKGEPLHYIHGHANSKPNLRPDAPNTPEEYRAWWARTTDEPFGLCHCGCKEQTPIASRSVRRRNNLIHQPRPYVNGHNARRNPTAYIEEDRGYETSCWIWQRSTYPSGYGITWSHRRGKQAAAHIVYYEDLYGSVPEGLDLHHCCEQRSCCNPNHVTPLLRDIHRQGHADRTSKLTPDLVREMRRLWRDGVTQHEIARRYGVWQGTAGKAIRGDTWTNVE